MKDMGGAKIADYFDKIAFDQYYHKRSILRISTSNLERIYRTVVN